MLRELLSSTAVGRLSNRANRRRTPRPFALPLCLLALVLAGCGAGGQGAPPGTGNPGETPSAPTTDGNAYFDALVARPDFWKGLSLRPIQGRADMTDPYYENQLLQTQFGGFAIANGRRLWVTYAPESDEDPHKQDAAKVVVPPFDNLDDATIFLASGCSSADVVLTLSRAFTGSELFANRAVLIDSEAMLISAVDLAAHKITVGRGFMGTRPSAHSAGAGVFPSTNSLPNQLRFPLGTEDGHTYLFTWDAFWTDSYVRSQLVGHKGFQLTSGGDTIWLETQLRYGPQRYAPGATDDDIGVVTLRSYNVLGGAASWSTTDGNHLGPGVTHDDPVLPMTGNLVIKPNRWTRFWIRIDQRANDYDYVDYWMADEETAPVQIYTQIPVSVRPTGRTPDSIVTWWIEMNSSQDRYIRPDLRDAVMYVRNFAVLRDSAAPTSLLQRPIP